MKNIKGLSREYSFNMGFQNNVKEEKEGIDFSEVLENIKANNTPNMLNTGITFFDQNTKFYKGNISLIAGRNTSKKELLLMDIALNAAKDSEKILYISCNKEYTDNDIANDLKERCIGKFGNDKILENIKAINVEDLDIVKLSIEIAKMDSKFGIDAVFIEDDKSLLYGSGSIEVKKQQMLTDCLAWQISAISKYFNISIFLGCRVRAKCEQKDIVDDYKDLKCSYSLIAYSKFIIGINYLGRKDDYNLLSINILKNSYGYTGINEIVEIL